MVLATLDSFFLGAFNSYFSAGFHFGAFAGHGDFVAINAVYGAFVGFSKS